MRLINQIKIFFCCCAGFFLISTSCNSSKETADKSEEFLVVNPIVTDTVYQTEYVALITALQNVEIRTRIKGFIDKIYVDEGKIVSGGQTLFTISSMEYQHALQKAKANVKSAVAELKSVEIELMNAQNLFDQKIISKPELELAKTKVEAMSAKVDEAKSEEAQAELNLSFTNIRAPFDGMINRIPNKAGSLVEEGSLLTSISDIKDVFAYFHVSEIDYLDYIATKQEGKHKEVSLVLANGAPYANKGSIETTETELDPSTGNIAFRARFPNPNGLLKHGANGKIVVTKPLKDVLLIPQKSTFEIQDKLFVYVVAADSTLIQRQVTSKMRIPHYYILESGLSKNETILFEGVQNVKYGTKISPKLISRAQLVSLNARN